MKKLAKLVAVLLVLLGVAVLGIFVYIDSIAKAAIERGSTYALGVETTLRWADVGILSGEFAMGGLKIDNPDGFDGDHFLQLERADVKVSLASLRQDTVELPLLVLSGVDMKLQRTLAGANYQVILDNLKRFESNQSKDPGLSDESGRTFVIREVLISDVNVEVDLLPIGGQLNRVKVAIDEIRLINVGSEGVSMSQLTNVIIQAILAAVVQNAADLPIDLITDLGGGLAGLTGLGLDATFKVGGEVTALVGDVLGEVTKAVGGAGEDVGKEIGKALEGLGGLLGGDKQ